MTINLVQQMGPEQAHRLLEQSFAQYQADRSVVGLVRGIERGKAMLDEIAAELGGPDAPILEYARMRARISEMERAQSRASRLQRRQAASDALAALRRGDIINITHGPPRRAGGGAGVGPRQRRPAAAGADRTPLGGADFVGGLFGCDGAGRVDVAAQAGRTPPAAGPARPGLGAAIRRRRAGGPGDAPAGRPRIEDDAFHDPELASLRRRFAPASRRTTAPGAGQEEQIREAERYLRIERDNAQLEKKVAAATNSLARTFDRIVGLLTEREFIKGSATDPPSHRRRPVAGPDLQRERPVGRRMPAHRRVGGLEPGRAGGGGLGGALRDPRRRRSQRHIRRRGAHTRDYGRRCVRRRGCPPRCAPTSRGTGSPRVVNPTTASSASFTAGPGPEIWPRRWPPPTRQGTGSPLLAGDFVRWCRQVLDLLDQVRNAAPDAELRATAKRAINDVRRGVVAVDAG